MSPFVWNDFRPPLHKEKRQISAGVFRKALLILSRDTLVEPAETNLIHIPKYKPDYP